MSTENKNGRAVVCGVLWYDSIYCVGSAYQNYPYKPDYIDYFVGLRITLRRLK